MAVAALGGCGHRGAVADGVGPASAPGRFSRGVDEAGQLDMGLVFVSYPRALAHFNEIQKRLAGEPLVDYVVPTGGGFFYCPPGAADSGDWVGSGLLA